MTITQTAPEKERWVPELDIPTRLRLVRREFGRIRGESLTQEGMAELIGVQKATYQGWEGGTSLPRDIVATAKTISDVTGVDPAWLLGINFEEVSTGVVRTGSRWLGFDPGCGADYKALSLPGCRIPGDSPNQFVSIEDVRLLVHDGPKRGNGAEAPDFFAGVVKGDLRTPRNPRWLVAESLRRVSTRQLKVDKYATQRDSRHVTSTAA